MEQSYLELNEGVYQPFPLTSYPSDPHEYIVKVKKAGAPKKQFVFDDTYPYLDHSFRYWFNRNVLGFPLMWFILVPSLFFTKGLKIKGRHHLRQYRKELKNGAVSVCNHVFQFDALCVIAALRPFRRMWIPILRTHFNGGQRWFVVNVGGVPVPDTRSGMRKFNEAFDEYHSRKEWIHVFPEAVRWDGYTPIRPFQKGAFSMAYKYNAPIVPCVLTYRERKGIYRLFGKKDNPLLTFNICEPILPNPDKPRKDEVDRLLHEAHAAMVKAAGIKHNPWPAEAESQNLPQ